MLSAAVGLCMARWPLFAQVEAESVEEVMTILRTGSMNRTTASTLMNDTSSRSHAVFTITMESSPKQGPPRGDLRLRDGGHVISYSGTVFTPAA